MLITTLKSKIHRATVVQANIEYIGSCEIDKNLLIDADIATHEQIHVLNVNNGERFVTYAIPSEIPGMVSVNGSAARKVAVGDVLIICAYGQITKGEVYEPEIVFVDKRNEKVSRDWKDKQNVISTIGYMGAQTCYLNTTLEDAIQRYADANDMHFKEVEKEYECRTVHIDDEFEVYDLSTRD